MLALLLLNTNQLVSTDQIIDEVWAASPPRSALAAVQMYVSALRRALTAPGTPPPGDPRRHPVLQTRANGYVLHVAAAQLDLSRFRVLAAMGRAQLAAGRCARAGVLFRRALAQWRGPAMADLTGRATLAGYASALDEERLSLLQQRIAVDLCQGRGLEVIGALIELSARYPLREAFHLQLMTALCLTGRQAEALQVYLRVYRTILDEAGVEPGPALRDGHRAILGGHMPLDGPHDNCAVARSS